VAWDKSRYPHGKVPFAALSEWIKFFIFFPLLAWNVRKWTAPCAGKITGKIDQFSAALVRAKMS
jgi:hypothetical protein